MSLKMHPADRGENQAVGLAGHFLDLRLVLLDAHLADDLLLDRQADPDAGVDAELLLREGGVDLGRAAELLALARLGGLAQLAARGGEVVAAHDDVLRRADDRLAVGRAEDVVGGHHQHRSPRPAPRSTSGRCTAIWSPSKSALKPLQTSGWMRMALPSISTGSKAWMPMRCKVGARLSSTGWLLDDLFQDVPDRVVLALQHLLGRLDRVGVAQLLEPANDERLEQFQGDLLRQTALVQPQFRADDDDRPGRVIDALAEQVLAEAALLALDHVGQRLERAIAAAQHRPLAAVVVEQRIHRLLQHPLLVADDDFRRVEIHQLLEPVVAVDDAPIEIVQVAGGEVAAVEQDERPEVRRDDRDALQHHPLGLVLRPAQARIAERFDHLEPLDEVAQLLLGRLVLRGSRTPASRAGRSTDRRG